MKKKYRNIIVDNEPYAYNYIPNQDPYEGGGTVKIWQNKKIIYSNKVDYDVIVTPSYIAELIAVINDYGDISDK